MMSGTVALVIGMYLCSYINQRSTVEELCTVKQITQAQVHVAWLERGGVDNQLFDSYALFATDPNHQDIAVDSLGWPINRVLERFRVNIFVKQMDIVR